MPRPIHLVRHGLLAGLLAGCYPEPDPPNPWLACEEADLEPGFQLFYCPIDLYCPVAAPDLASHEEFVRDKFPNCHGVARCPTERAWVVTAGSYWCGGLGYHAWYFDETKRLTGSTSHYYRDKHRDPDDDCAPFDDPVPPYAGVLFGDDVGCREDMFAGRECYTELHFKSLTEIPDPMFCDEADTGG